MRLGKMLIRNKRLRFTITNAKNLLLFLVAGFLGAQQTPQELVDKMGRGINLGNVLSAPVEGNWSGIATEQYFQEVAQAALPMCVFPLIFLVIELREVQHLSAQMKTQRLQGQDQILL